MYATKLMQGAFPLVESQEVDDGRAIGDDFDEEEVQRSLVRAKRIALANKQEEGDVKSGPHARALFAPSTSTTNKFGGENESRDKNKKMVFTEMDGFFSALEQDDVESRAPSGKDDLFGEVKEIVTKVEASGKKEEKIAPDETIREVGVGKGLVGTLKLLKDRGALNESIEWGGRNTNKKRFKLGGIYDKDPEKPNKRKEEMEINIERKDEFGRVLTPKEAFRALSHKFHGVVPGKKKQEKRLRQYQEELIVKQMANYDTPNRSVKRTREALAQQKSPYLVISGHVKPDPK